MCIPGIPWFPVTLSIHVHVISVLYQLGGFEPPFLLYHTCILHQYHAVDSVLKYQADLKSWARERTKRKGVSYSAYAVEHYFSQVDQPMSKFGMHFYGMGGPLYAQSKANLINRW